MDFLSRPFIAELFLTVALNQKHLQQLEHHRQVMMWRWVVGILVVDRGDDTPDNSGIVAECTITSICQDGGQPVRELVDTTKPKKKCTKCACERDDMAVKVLTMLEKDDDEDEVSLALASIGKRIKKSLNDAQVDAVLDELNEVVGHHVRTARGGGIMGYQRQPSVTPAPQTHVPPQQQQISNYQPMPLPLQRLDIAYEPMTNNSYQNL